MKGYANRNRRTVGIIAAALVAAMLFLLIFWFGVIELSTFNSRSVLEWRLGAPISGISGPEDGRNVILPQYEWYEDGQRAGLKSADGGTYYFMGMRPDAGFGSYCVTGFVTNERDYSILGIRIGDDELAAKTKLLNEGYSINSGALDRCLAEKGKITVILAFAHGCVTQMEAHLKTTDLFG